MGRTVSPYCICRSTAGISMIWRWSSSQSETVFFSTLTLRTFAVPDGVETVAPTFGILPRSSRYPSYSNVRQQYSRPHTPEIFCGLSGSSCSFAILIETAGNEVCQDEQQSRCPQTSFPAVSIKMAKEQELPLNPQKISGVCGRLYCCLTFEYEGYRELRGQLPKVGAMVSTPSGNAKVRSVNVLKKTVSLWLEDQRQIMEMPAVDLQMQYGLTVRPIELVQEIEAPLKATPAAPAASAVTTTSEPASERPRDTAAAPPPAGEGDAARKRRRGRRGGRNRRPGGEGGSPPGPASSNPGP